MSPQTQVTLLVSIDSFATVPAIYSTASIVVVQLYTANIVLYWLLIHVFFVIVSIEMVVFTLVSLLLVSIATGIPSVSMTIATV